MVVITFAAAVIAIARRRGAAIAQEVILIFLVNAVGGYAGGIKLWEMNTKTFDQMLALNLRSGYVLSRAAVKAMLKQGQGTIVNVAAKAALDHGAGASAQCHLVLGLHRWSGPLACYVGIRADILRY